MVSNWVLVGGVSLHFQFRYWFLIAQCITARFGHKAEGCNIRKYIYKCYKERQQLVDRFTFPRFENLLYYNTTMILMHLKRQKKCALSLFLRRYIHMHHFMWKTCQNLTVILSELVLVLPLFVGKEGCFSPLIQINILQLRSFNHHLDMKVSCHIIIFFFFFSSSIWKISCCFKKSWNSNVSSTVRVLEQTVKVCHCLLSIFEKLHNYWKKSLILNLIKKKILIILKKYFFSKSTLQQ